MERREGVYQETGPAADRFAGPVETAPAALDLAPAPSSLPTCANCTRVLSGPFCAQCGQHVADYHQSVWRFVSDFLDNTFCWDNRLLRTLGRLFRQPGFLTREFMAGRRVRYVHPLRLFLFTSAVCITLWHFGDEGQDRAEHAARHRHKPTAAAPAQTPGEAKARDPDGAGDKNDATTPGPDKSLPAVPARAADLAKWGVPVPAGSASPAYPAAAAPSPGGSPGIPSPDEIKAEIRDSLKTDLGDENAGKIAKIGGDIGESVKTTVARDGIDRITQNISEGFRRKLSWMTLGLLPVFALMLRSLYWRKDTYYFLHLVFSLHYHTFLLIFWTVRGWLDVILKGTSLHFLAAWCLLGAPVYLYAALRQVYGGSPRRTLTKTVILGGLHLLAIFIGLAIIGGLSVFMALR